MKIGITGSEGFIGRYLVKKIKDPEIFKGDLKELSLVREFVNKCDRIYHIAGKNREPQGEILSNNLLSTGNLLLAMKLENKHPELVFTSSKQVEWNPESEYGLTKSIEEEIIKKSKKWCIFRIPNVYGPECKPFYNSVVATFSYQIANNQSVTITDPEAKREFVYITDLVDLLIKPTFNNYLSIPGEVLSIREIYDFLTAKLGQHKKLQSCLDFYKHQK